MKCEQLVRELASIRAQGGTVRLGKSTSNLFRHRDGLQARKLHVRSFDRVLSVDPERCTAEVEGMVPYDVFADETLRYGLLPCVTPELKSITVGGAVSGVGIESSSFRYGLAHETVEEMDILLGSGAIVTCSRTQNQDLFFGFPNSYGTLGYALRLKVRLMPARRYVHLRHIRFSDAESFFPAIAERCTAGNLDFLDGTIFGADEMYISEGRFSEQAPHVSDYTWMNIYYRSIQRKGEDWLRARNYIWRWDTDWFWCSKQLYAQHRFIRLLATRRLLNSRTYQRLMRLAHRLLTDSGGTEPVIQDVDIEIGKAPEFLKFLLSEIGITPIWICPARSYDPGVTYPLYRLDTSATYINFGFWDVIPSRHEPGYYNRKVEQKMLELDGKKGLYSAAYFDEETFREVYDGTSYAALKAKYDPDRVLGDLYEKCVGARAGHASKRVARA